MSITVPGIEWPVLEMETAGVARVAAEQGVPLSAMRSISDSVAEPLPFSIEGSLDQDGRLRLGRIAIAAIRDPRLIPRFARLQRNMAGAMANLVAALRAALEAQLPG